MSDHYQKLDAPHFDYQIGAVPGISHDVFRGPVPNLTQPYIACIGGAQTFGRFVAEPYPAELSRSLGMPCVNLGIGGGGPRFAIHPEVLAVLQRARLVIVQMFSGRSATNSLFDNSSSGGRNYGRVVGTDAWQSFEDFLADLWKLEDPVLQRRVIREMREDYEFCMASLARQITAPKVLFWWSRRAPDYQIDWTQPNGVLAEYPQLIDREGVERMRRDFDAYVECVSSEGLPQRLWNADAAVIGTEHRAGQLWNTYYPSPQMHAAAAASLLPTCRRMLRSP